MAARHRRHHVEAPKPAWLVTIKAAPPAPARGDAAKKLAAPARSPILLSPSAWQKAQLDKKDVAVGDRGDTGVAPAPASPRIGCMGQVKGTQRCSRARCPASSRGPAASGLPCGSLAGLLMGLFGWRSTGRKTRAYSKVRDVASDTSSSGSARGARAPSPLELDPPLPVPAPVVRRPALEENAPSLWERRRGGAKVLEGLQLA
ncbi:hypothetical protein CFC21_053492 [Triticum aestivum]|uniref:Uncharacterized protein n=3 Tax=Triticum TaxID=4564 RepID=A0A9R0W3F5_TRITD|nr:hypothetical protein CFC21_053492 [Triticum aestivum]VAH95324.1 unnamed protein product [Triticum turgidum subsp. durum]